MPLRVHIVLWLALLRRHWTANRRIRHGLQVTKECALCNQEDEIINHRLVHCSYSRQVERPLCFRPVRRLWSKEHRRGFDSLFALISWEIWKERNSRCFRETERNPSALLQIIKVEARQWVRAGAKNLAYLCRE